MTFQQVNQLYKKHARWVPIIAFLVGFLFDMVTLSRIDDVIVILQQALYLLIAAALTAVELTGEDRDIASPTMLGKVWKYREAFLHFLLGALLNSYAIFYFKSASALTSFFFIALLLGKKGFFDLRNELLRSSVHPHMSHGFAERSSGIRLTFGRIRVIPM